MSGKGDSASLPGDAGSPSPLFEAHLCQWLFNQPPSLLLSLFLQVPKVTKAHPAHLGPRALRVPQGPPEAEDPKALVSQTCSTASAQVTHPCPREPPLQLMIPNSQASPRLCDQICFKQREILPKASVPTLQHVPGRPEQSAWGEDWRQV